MNPGHGRDRLIARFPGRLQIPTWYSAFGLALILTLAWWFSDFLSVGVGMASESQAIPAQTKAVDYVRIQPGSFEMGCSVRDSGCAYNELPVHAVKITKAFEMGRYEVTQSQWKQVMGTNPSRFKGDTRPVEQVTWQDTQDFVGRLNMQNDGYRYRLPTEAEWEYAARAGRNDAGIENADLVAWFGENAGGETHPVGAKQANPWGLYDMQGNVQEWVQDWYGNFTNNPATDPMGPASGNRRVLRGGSLEFCPTCVRLSVRSYLMPDVRSFSSGFRLVREDIRQ